jgi:hypothetical protein
MLALPVMVALPRLTNSSAPLAGHGHVYIVARTMGTDQPLSPIGNGSLGAVSLRHFGWRSHLRWLRQELRSGIGTCATFGDGGFATTRPQGGCGTK